MLKGTKKKIIIETQGRTTATLQQRKWGTRQGYLYRTIATHKFTISLFIMCVTWSDPHKLQTLEKHPNVTTCHAWARLVLKPCSMRDDHPYISQYISVLVSDSIHPGIKFTIYL